MPLRIPDNAEAVRAVSQGLPVRVADDVAVPGVLDGQGGGKRRAAIVPILFFTVAQR